MLSAEGEYTPVFVSPEKVKAGAPTLPRGAVTTPLKVAAAPLTAPENTAVVAVKPADENVARCVPPVVTATVSAAEK